MLKYKTISISLINNECLTFFQSDIVCLHQCLKSKMSAKFQNAQLILLKSKIKKICMIIHKMVTVFL